MEEKSTYQLFTRSGCLTPEGMALFADNKLSRREMDLVNKHLEECELCSLAMEGFMLYPQEQFDEDLQDIKKGFSSKQAVQPVVYAKKLIPEPSVSLHAMDRITPQPEEKIPEIRHTGKFRTILVAAAFILLFTVAGWFLILLYEIIRPQKQADLAVITKTEKSTAPARPSDYPSIAQESVEATQEAETSHPPLPPPAASARAVPIVQHDKEKEAVKTVPEMAAHENIQAKAAAGERQIYADAQAVEDDGKDALLPEEIMEEEAEAGIFMVVEEAPVFPGGEEALRKFLKDNIRYPQQALDASLQGTVFVTFVVEQDGSIGNARVLRGIGKGCDEEALRVVKMMPAWKPGTQRGKPVKVQINLPVRFALTND